jgi:hypothetical protein
MTVTASPESTSVSPELALVDPGLAEWARKRLPTAPDTLEALRDAPPTATSARGRRRRPSRILTGAGLLGVLGGMAFLVGSRADVDRPVAAPLTAIAQPPVAKAGASKGVTASRARSPRRSTGAAGDTRRFAWAPVSGATGYHVELFRGSTLIFRNATKKPEILLRRRWRFNGHNRRLEPGAYRWYVWPLVRGQRQAKAIVQTKLVVSR